MKLTVYADNHNAIPDTESSQSVHYSEAIESPNAVFDEVEVFDALEYTGYDFINSMQQKVRHGGKIKFVGTDAIEVIRAIHSGSAFSYSFRLRQRSQASFEKTLETMPKDAA